MGFSGKLLAGDELTRHDGATIGVTLEEKWSISSSWTQAVL